MIVLFANLIARLKCRWKGHLRGKLVERTQSHKVFRCGRCQRTTKYAIRKAA